MLRRFSDTDGDNVVDQWQYYNQGIEVYRDLDSNNNNKVDQSRWLNTAGTRWGLDTNEDGQIDSWKMISAEEAGRLAVEAMIAGDVKTLETLLISPGDIKTLGIEEDDGQAIVGGRGFRRRENAKDHRQFQSPQFPHEMDAVRQCQSGRHSAG